MTMKLTPEKLNELRSVIELELTIKLDTMLDETMDNEFRDLVIDDLGYLEIDFTEDEIDEIREMWNEGLLGIDDLYDKIIEGITNSIMKKFENS